MKTTITKLASLLLVMIACMSFNQAKAQSGHLSCAPNCQYWKITGKKPPKGSVSCIDRTCSICAKKQKEEQDKKEKAAQQKIDAWKAGEKTRQADTKQKQQEAIKTKEKNLKAEKDNEMVLVAPKPKVTENKNTSIKLSAQDQEILELGKKNTVRIANVRDYGNGYGYFLDEKIYGSLPIDRIYYEEKGSKTVLKDLKLKDYGYSYKVGNKLDDMGNFCIEYTGMDSKDLPWSDIVTLEGENLLNDKTIEKVTYKGNGIYELQKRGEKTPTLQYNFKTKKITPIQ